MSEMTTCIQAGKHPGLIPVLGRIAHHPAGANGLVMSLIDTRFRNLAAPPSLQSCTRDVYAQGVRFDLTGLFWTKLCEKLSLERNFSYAEEEVQRGADRGAAPSD